MKNNYINQVVHQIINNGAVRATKYVSPKEIIRVTRKLSRGKIDGRDRNITMILTIGRPNYVEREFVKLCQKAKEPFPVKKIQVKLYKPKKTTLKPKTK